MLPGRNRVDGWMQPVGLVSAACAQAVTCLGASVTISQPDGRPAAVALGTPAWWPGGSSGSLPLSISVCA